MPALVNAHDHARPLSPTSFGAAAKPLETWLLRLAAMPPIDPYLGALAAFGRAARGGAASVMAHYTRFHGPDAAGRGGARDSRAPRPRSACASRFAVFMRDRNPLVYGHADGVLAALPEPRARPSRRTFLSAHAERRGADRARRGDRRGGREPDVHRPVRPQRPAMVLGRAARRDRRALARNRPARAHASAGDALSARLRRQRLSRGRRSSA